MISLLTKLNGRKVQLLSACFVFMLLAISSCKKTNATFGASVLSPEDLLSSGATDTFNLQTYSEIADSVPTDNQAFAILGSCQDPKMGRITGSFYTQFDLVGTVAFPSGSVATIDSVVLALEYGGFYGKQDVQTFEVFQINEDLYNDSVYYKTTTKSVVGTDLVDPTRASLKMDPTTKVVIGAGDTLKAQIRLKLNNALGQQFIDDAIAGNVGFDSDELFKTYFKGLRVGVINPNTAPGTGGIGYFNLNDANSKLTVYYKLVGNTSDYTLDFEVSNKCADFNHVEIDQTGYDIENVLADPNNGLDQFYSQAFESRAKIDFSSINNIPKNSIVHAALLELPIAFQTFDLYYPSTSLTVGYKTDQGNIIGFQLVGFDNARKSYIIDLRNYVQDILKGDAVNRGIYVYPTFFSSTTERMIFNGPATTNKLKPKLTIKYTEF